MGTPRRALAVSELVVEILRAAPSTDALLGLCRSATVAADVAQRLRTLLWSDRENAGKAVLEHCRFTTYEMVTVFAISKDARRFLTGANVGYETDHSQPRLGRSGMLKLWNASTGTTLMQITATGEDSGIVSCTFDAEDKKILAVSVSYAAGDTDGVSHNIQHEYTCWTFDATSSGTLAVCALGCGLGSSAFCASGKRLATSHEFSLAEEDGNTKIWDVCSSTVLHVIPAIAKFFDSCVFFREGAAVAVLHTTAGVGMQGLDDDVHRHSDSSVAIRDNLGLATTIRVGEDAYHFAFAADDRYILVSYEAVRVTMWDRETCRPVRKFQQASAAALHLSVYDDLALTTHSAGNMPGALIFDSNTGQVLRYFKEGPWDLDSPRPVACLFFSDGRRIAIISSSMVRIWNIVDGGIDTYEFNVYML